MNDMSPDVHNLLAFLQNLREKTVPEISQACAQKIRRMELTGDPDRALVEHLKSMILLIRHLRRPPVARDEMVRRFLIEFFTRIQQHDRRAKHVLEVLRKMEPGNSQTNNSTAG
ncbi:hypothetical protein J2Z49_002283 [Desulfofundulus luciae]|uniref:DUF438 domain-containing protein n=2 Tax=Desulfofundulus luciae TaxID=74702 RepID=A0ABU0B366_9FIRM|nr:hypothetical protein [Desulfofundulus luciae]